MDLALNFIALNQEKNFVPIPKDYYNPFSSSSLPNQTLVHFPHIYKYILYKKVIIHNIWRTTAERRNKRFSYSLSSERFHKFVYKIETYWDHKNILKYSVSMD